MRVELVQQLPEPLPCLLCTRGQRRHPLPQNAHADGAFVPQPVDVRRQGPGVIASQESPTPRRAGRSSRPRRGTPRPDRARAPRSRPAGRRPGSRRGAAWVLLSLATGVVAGVLVAALVAAELASLTGWSVAAATALVWVWRISWPMGAEGTKGVFESYRRGLGGAVPCRWWSALLRSGAALRFAPDLRTSFRFRCRSPAAVRALRPCGPRAVGRAHDATFQTPLVLLVLLVRRGCGGSGVGELPDTLYPTRA